MADIQVMRRWAETMIAVGLLVMAMTAAAFAQDPTPAPTPEPTAEPVVTVSATPTAAATLTSTPVPTPTAAPTETPTPEPTVTATPEAVSEAPVLTARKPQTARRPRPVWNIRAAATPPPEPTPTPPDQITGASLTLCHFTDPGYVAVVISADQYSLYYEEEDDIIPAPPEGCDNITEPGSYADDEVTSCHLNPDGTYTFFSFPPGDLNGHEFDKGDLIPAPQRLCPTPDGFYAIPTVTATPTANPTASATATPDGGDVEGEGDGGEEETDGTDDPCFGGCGEVEFDTTGNAGDVAGGMENGAAASELPFTGFDLWLIAVAGLALTMMGAGLRLLSQPPAVGVTR